VKAGVLLAVEGLQPRSKGKRVHCFWRESNCHWMGGWWPFSGNEELTRRLSAVS